MIKISNVKIEGWEPAIRGMRNSFNSWDSSDSLFLENGSFSIGPEDATLMKALSAGPPSESKFQRMIIVWCDIDAPLYWWKQFDTYKVGTVANSCSTMHTICDHPFTVENFGVDEPFTIWEAIVRALNAMREYYLQAIERGNKEAAKSWWRNIIQLLPESYNQKRTVCVSYAALKAMWKDRHNHKLSEWHEFCDWVESLPCSQGVITPEKEKENKE